MAVPHSSQTLFNSFEPIALTLISIVAVYALFASAVAVYNAFQRRSSPDSDGQSKTVRDELADMHYQLLSMRDAVALASKRASVLEEETEDMRAELTSQAMMIEKLTAPVEADRSKIETTEPVVLPFKLVSEDTVSEEAETEHVQTTTAESEAAPDDLTRIWGIGAGNQQKLQENGIYYFHQIAAWSADDVDRFNAILAFRGRIEREDWVAQAQTLSKAVKEIASRAA